MAMDAQVIAAITAFAIGVIVTALTNWFARRLEQRKHVAQRASDAYADMANAYTAYRGCESLLSVQAGQMSQEELRDLQRKMSEVKAQYLSAKARIAVFGSSSANLWFADIERRGGVSGKDVMARELTTHFVQSVREQLGFAKNDVPHEDLETVLFGPREEDQASPPTNGTRGWSLDDGGLRSGL
jgi:hypothetical protein